LTEPCHLEKLVIAEGARLLSITIEMPHGNTSRLSDRSKLAFAIGSIPGCNCRRHIKSPSLPAIRRNNLYKTNRFLGFPCSPIIRQSSWSILSAQHLGIPQSTGQHEISGQLHCFQL
jgi:hypothetical protein